jgi:DNA-binding response OmpR family regulator
MPQHSTILIVDDHPSNVALLEEILGDDYQLKTATCGEEALAVAPDCQPDLILLDIMMPGLDGYETCRRLRAHPLLRQPKILMVSAKALVSERLHGYEAGADDYITKPFDAGELLAKVRVYLRLKTAEDAEQALLEQTLRGSVKVLTDILALVNPIAFGQAMRLKRYVGHIAAHVALPDL